MGWRSRAAGGSIDERGRYARIQAAAAGDRDARDAIVGEARSGLTRHLQREMEAAHLDTSDALLSPVVEHACRVAFDSISEKPANWSLYGWMVWHVDREAWDAGATRSLPSSAAE
jgi:hypothetical protein